MDRKQLKKALIDIAKDILIAFIVVVIVMVALFAYCGIWPPMVVVESGSMQHADDHSSIGVIDTGDMVFVKTIDGREDIVTYVEGEMSEYSKYGSYGDVIIYRPNNDTEKVPIIHRPVLWLDVNDTAVSPSFNGIDYANYTFDVPSLGLYGTAETIVLENYGHTKATVSISLDGLLVYYNITDQVPHGGFITMGDHNVPLYDQPMWGSYEPVLPDWIVGKAVGEIPWFGLIKLKVTGTDLQDVPQNSWRNLIITLFIILLVPFLFDLFAPKVAKKLKERKERKKKQDGEGNEQSAAEPEQPPPQEDMGGASESREMKTDPASASEPKIHTEKTKNETE